MGKLHGKILHFLQILEVNVLYIENVGIMQALSCAELIVDGKKGLVNIISILLL